LRKVYLGADYDTGDFLYSTKVDDLVINDLDHFKGISRGDRVDENKAMDADGMLGVEDRVLVLANEVW
jgi:nanoRNase/pAp phosphatase (c-di-AMP/oligoRNAs hydrolase)